jgi:type IV pilus assembly protein PilQ
MNQHGLLMKAGLVALLCAGGPVRATEQVATRPLPAAQRALTGAAEARPLPAAQGVDSHIVLQRVDEQEVARAATRLTDLRVAADKSGNGAQRVRLVTDGEVARYTLIELREPGRLALDLHGVAGTTHKLPPSGSLRGVRAARHEDGVRVVLDGDGERLSTYRVERRVDGLEVLLAAPTIAQATTSAASTPLAVASKAVAVASAPVPAASATAAAAPAPVAPAPLARPAHSSDDAASPQPAAATTGAPKAREGAPLSVATALAAVKAVDLRTQSGRTEVEIAIDGAYRFEVGHPTATAVVLTLHGVSLPERLERNLDATALGGPVDLLSCYRIPDRQGEARIVATLKAGTKDELDAGKQGLRWRFGDAAIARAVAPVAARAGAMAAEGAAAQPAAPPAAAPGSAQQPTAMQSVLDDRNYSGRRVDFNVKDIDIRNLLNAIADISKKNVVVTDEVKGTVTIKLRNVPWDQALDIILKSKGLAKEEVGNIIRIAPQERLRAEAKEAADAAKVKQSFEPLKVRLIPVNYATAVSMVDKIKDSLTDRGSVTTDIRTNTLIVKDVSDALLRAEGIVRNLDTQTPEVLIESRIVEASASFSRAAGIQWGGNIGFGPNTGNPTGLVFPSILQIAGAADDGSAPLNGLNGLTTPNFAVNMPAPIGLNNGAGVGMIFGSAGGSANLNLRLSAAENTGTAKTISSPRVVTLDNMAATISQGVSIPYSQVSSAGATTAFLDATLSLSVTPHVTQEGSVQLKIQASNDSPNTSITGSNGQPAINRRAANTQVLVKDGDTTVIGGIYTRVNGENWNEVPILANIPVLGWLFKHKSVSDNRTELLIFITPRIVNRAQSVVAEARGGEGNP